MYYMNKYTFIIFMVIITIYVEVKWSKTIFMTTYKYYTLDLQANNHAVNALKNTNIKNKFKKI